jgi:hypothetical protein
MGSGSEENADHDMLHCGLSNFNAARMPRLTERKSFRPALAADRMAPNRLSDLVAMIPYVLLGNHP